MIEKIPESYSFNLDSSLKGLCVKDILILVKLGDGRIFKRDIFRP